MSILHILMIPLPIVPRIIPLISALPSILWSLLEESIPPIWLPPIIVRLKASLLPLGLLVRVQASSCCQILTVIAKPTRSIGSIFPHNVIILILLHSPLGCSNKGLYAYKIEDFKYQYNRPSPKQLIKNDNINHGKDL